MKQIMLWGVCDCVFMTAIVIVSVLSTLAIGM